MYKVRLYFSFATITATVDKEPDGEMLLFNTLKEAEAYGRSTGVMFEAVEVK